MEIGSGQAQGDGFWADLNRDLADPKFRRHYLRESERIAEIDRILQGIDGTNIRTISAMTGLSLERLTELGAIPDA
ncbi:MAG: hypothetical protein ACT4QF_24505 [Sporichthyaceae bacterium]